ncbi:MAG: hypothetical protein HPZ92_03350 [Oscillospiraceae bacterium]|nr:hypothetical protein [Oscillospiraceae bacterium]
MTAYQRMYYYLDHAISEALREMEQQNFGTARETLRQAQELADKMRRKEEGTTDVHEYIRNPYDFIERKIP